MAGLDHHAPAPEEARDPISERHNARLGLILFAIYFAGYVAYVGINAFWPDLMDAVPLLGLNWAVVSGMGLILGALALSLVYAALCKTPKGTRS